jgi:hypothetical protein
MKLWIATAGMANSKRPVEYLASAVVEVASIKLPRAAQSVKLAIVALAVRESTSFAEFWCATSNFSLNRDEKEHKAVCLLRVQVIEGRSKVSTAGSSSSTSII